MRIFTVVNVCLKCTYRNYEPFYLVYSLSSVYVHNVYLHTIHIAQTVAKFSRKFIEFKTVKRFTCKTVGTAKPNAVAKLSKIILDICKIITIIESLLS